MRRWVLGGAFPALLVVAWEALAAVGLLSAEGFSRPTAIGAAAARALLDGSLLVQTGQTLGAAAQGLLIAAVAGVGCGTLLGLVRPLERATALGVDALRPVPSVALIPVALLVFGFSRAMSAAVAAFACFWPILLVTVASVRSVDPRLDEVGRMLGYPLWQRIAKLALPAALPGIVVGIRVAAGIAIVVTVTTEIVANPRGLGYAMTLAAETLQSDRVWATLLWIGVVGFALNVAMSALERRCLRWYWTGRS